jgi:hypothetical protein
LRGFVKPPHEPASSTSNMLAAGRADAGLGIDEIERLSRFADSITKGVSMGERISFEFNGHDYRSIYRDTGNLIRLVIWSFELFNFFFELARRP